MFAAYAPVLGAGFISFDDPPYVSKNLHVQGGLSWASIKWALTTFEGANYHPLTWLSLMLDWQVYGDHPWGFHLTNLLLHAANALLLWRLLESLTGSRWRAVLAAGLFALHPMRVESVAWVSERKDVLSACLGLLAMLVYVRVVRRPGARGWALLCVLAALSLLAKPMLVTLPFLLVVLDCWPLGRARSWRSLGPLLLEKWPLLLLSVASSVATFIVQHSQGATAELARFTIDARLANSAVALMRYIGKVFWPAGLSVFYPYPLEGWPALTIACAAALLVAVTVAAVRLASRMPWVLAGWLWFLGMMVPVIGLVQVGQQAMADRYIYLPGIGLLLMVVWSLPERWSSAPRRAGGALAALAVLALLAAITFRQSALWRDSLTLFEHAIAVTPPHYLTQSHLAIALEDRGRLDEAIGHYKQALEIRPDFVDGYVNLGLVLARQGKGDDAIECFRKAVELGPGQADVQTSLGVALLERGDVDEALEHLLAAARIAPDHVEAQRALGKLYAHRHADLEASSAYLRVLAHEPEDLDAHRGLAMLSARQGRPSEAIPHLQAVIRRDSHDAVAHANLGAAHLQLGRIGEAVAEFRLALTIDPNQFGALINLSRIAGDRGQFKEALAWARKAVEVRPQEAEARRVLGAALFQNGSREAAVAQYREAMKLRPGDPDLQAEYEEILGHPTSATSAPAGG
ncbi:MAG: tetratricopeptide repeat protein [Planctomycetota bacterium]|nr:tetratricopeptide repeat protein [Planctomycetota bacterium]